MKENEREEKEILPNPKSEFQTLTWLDKQKRKTQL